MAGITRRTLLLASPLVLTGCVSDSGDGPGLGLSFDGFGGGGRYSESDYRRIYAGFNDGGFRVAPINVDRINRRYLRQEVASPGDYPADSIVVDPGAHFLYYVQGGGRAIRYGVGVGREGFGWNGKAVIRRKATWPTWTPPASMVARDPNAAPWANGMPGGPQNPLGARAMYLYQGNRDTLYRVHGTNDPSSIGKSMSSGCIRLLNQDIIDLFGRTSVGTRVTVLGSGRGNFSADDEQVSSRYVPPEDLYEPSERRPRRRRGNRPYYDADPDDDWVN